VEFKLREKATQKLRGGEEGSGGKSIVNRFPLGGGS
jgi:hypothetical protein